MKLKGLAAVITLGISAITMPLKAATVIQPVSSSSSSIFAETNEVLPTEPKLGRDLTLTESNTWFFDEDFLHTDNSNIFTSLIPADLNTLETALDNTFNSFVVQPTLTAESALEILKNNPIRVETKKENPQLKFYEIQAFFEPKDSSGSVELDSLAKALGVDHFNWVQTVTHLPNHWKVNIMEAEWIRDANKIIPKNLKTIETDILTKDKGFIDFILQPETARELTYLFKTKGGFIYWRQENADSKLPYWNEDAREPSIDVKTYTSSHQLKFYDRPTQPNFALDIARGDMIQFKTELVGVKSDGTIVRFPNTPTSFTWKSNAIFDGKGGSFRHGKGGETNMVFPPAMAGGVFDVQILGDPASEDSNPNLKPYININTNMKVEPKSVLEPVSLSSLLGFGTIAAASALRKRK